MRRLLLIIAALAAIIIISGLLLRSDDSREADTTDSATLPAETAIIAERLVVPWEIAFLPDGDMLVTERPGTLKRIGKNKQTHAIDGVVHRGEGGLLGLALHPRFVENQWIYLYLTTRAGDELINRVERYRLRNDALTGRTEIISSIPGASVHDGGRIAFSPDGYLFITTSNTDGRGDPQPEDDRIIAIPAGAFREK